MNEKKYKRIFTVVIDSLGAGEMPDAASYGDAGTDTLGHIAANVEEFKIPNLQKLGIANLKDLAGIAPVEKPLAYYGKLREASNGKDTMTGHWEMMGLHITTPFKTFTETGFPKELIDELSKRTGRTIIGNKSASGTEILDELAEEEIATGHMIVYTSADSVLQICGNEETFGLDELYRCCEIAREITMKDEWKVGRVIARPYVGKKKGEFKRTSNRHDYALKPYGRTALNALKDAGLDVISVGKIFDIFDGEGITESNKSKSSVHGMEQTIEIAKRDFEGFCFVNLVDFLAAVAERFDVAAWGDPGCGEPGADAFWPREKGTFGMFLGGRWYRLRVKPEFQSSDPVKGLDVSILQDQLLGPVLGVGDPRTDKRIDFIGGIRGLKELERRVSEDMEAAFSMYPTSIEELLAVADAGLLMPPKSTWCEPKLRSGLFIHRLG